MQTSVVNKHFCINVLFIVKFSTKYILFQYVYVFKNILF